MAGYNVYRRAASESSFTQLNSQLLETLTFIDPSFNPGTLYYYAVTSVDDDGDESAKSISITPAGSSSSSDKPALTTACFVNTVSANSDYQQAILIFLLVMSILPGIVWILCHVASRRKQ